MRMRHLPINSAFTHRLATGIISCFVMILLLDIVEWSNGLRLTHMTVPLVADFREVIDLDCKFDMGDEELYAIKWYKDDQEFFRYMPGYQPHIMSFPVPGVHIVFESINCSLVRCKMQLKNLTRHHSGGAYRCEISSEAPAFRLAAETHNVTVAAIPRKNPRIESLTTSYMEGDTIEAKCVSDPADPAPILSWYINGLEVPSRVIGDMISSQPDELGLVSRSLVLHLLVERKYSRGNSIDLRCVSSLPGVPLSPQETTFKIPMRTPNVQVMKNQQLYWLKSSSRSANLKVTWILVIICAVRWCINTDDV